MSLATQPWDLDIGELDRRRSIKRCTGSQIPNGSIKEKCVCFVFVRG